MKHIMLTLLFFSYISFATAGPKVEQWFSENGANVLFVQADDLPMVDLRIIFAAGASHDGKLFGLANAVNALITEGAHGITATDIAKRLEEVGIKLSTGSARDMAWINIRSLSKWENLRHGLDVINLMLTKPDFNKQAIDRQKRMMRIGLEEIKQSPAKIAGRELYSNVFPNHPYGKPSGGNEETIELISREDIVEFFQRYYVGANATVAIVGDVDKVAAKIMVESAFAEVPPGEKAEEIPKVKCVAGKEIKVDFPSQQTHILLGQPAIKKGDNRFPALYVGNYILGGGSLLSLLGEEIRVKRGLAYSVYSYFSTMQQRGAFIIGSQTRGEEAEQAVGVMRRVLTDFIENGPTEEQLIAAKKNITGGYPLQTASNSAIVGYLGMLGFYNLPLDYMDTFTAKIEKVTAKDVQNAFSQAVKPEKMIVVKVGGTNSTSEKLDSKKIGGK